MAISPELNDKLLRMLRRRHPDYQGRIAHWMFLQETYEGGRDWFIANIFRYLKEGDQEFKDRLARCYRFNHTREIVDLIQKYIFKSPPGRNEDDASPEIKDFWANATLTGHDINQFSRLMSTASSIDGRIWVFTDTTKTADVVSVADEKKKGVRVYAYIVRAKDVLDIGLDEETQSPRWILVREWFRDDADPLNSSCETEERYRLWTETEWKLYRIIKKNPGVDRASVTAEAGSFAVQPPTSLNPSTTVNLYANVGNSVEPTSEDLVVDLIDEGVNPLGRIPGFPVDHVVGDYCYTAPSLIDDIAYLDRANANYLSNMDAIIQDQTFSQLAMPAQGLLPGDDKYDQMREMGTKRIFTFDGEGGAKPEYISPDPRQVSVITDTINKIINEIYHTVGMAGERTKQDNSVGIDNSSGVAKAYDFERLNSLLAMKSEALENAENKLIELVCLWRGVAAPAEKLVRYADDFDVRSLFDEFTVAQNLALIDAPPTIRRAQMQHVKNKLFPVIGKTENDEMEKDLESWPKDPIEQAAAMAKATAPTAFPGKAATPGQSKNGKTQSRQGQVTSQTK